MTERMLEDPASTGWHLDKRIPIALIVALFTNTAGLVAWGSRIDFRVSQLEESRSQQVDQPNKIVRLETKMEGVQESLKDINGKLDRLLDKAP